MKLTEAGVADQVTEEAVTLEHTSRTQVVH